MDKYLTSEVNNSRLKSRQTFGTLKHKLNGVYKNPSSQDVSLSPRSEHKKTRARIASAFNHRGTNNNKFEASKAQLQELKGKSVLGTTSPQPLSFA